MKAIIAKASDRGVDEFQRGRWYNYASVGLFLAAENGPRAYGFMYGHPGNIDGFWWVAATPQDYTLFTGRVTFDIRVGE